MSESDPRKIAEWVEKQLNDALTEAELDQLEEELQNNHASRELYLDLMQQNALLHLERFSFPKIDVRSDDHAVPASTGDPPDRKLAWRSAIAVLAACIFLVLWWNGRPKGTLPREASLATIIDSSDAKWGDCTLPTAVGSDLSAGRLRIERGLTTIRFSSGAEVTLESPAEIEIESPLRGRLLAGAAVVEVPDSAHGFTLATPTALAIDYGTAFSITIDPSSQASSIEVLDGEVEVQHLTSRDSRRLMEHQRVVASKDGIGSSEALTDEAELAASATHLPRESNTIRITTADGRGDDASVGRSQDEDVKKNDRSELVLIKNPHVGFERFSRKGYFAFDLASTKGASITSAEFVVTLQPSGFGFASKVDHCEFIVYGLTDESADEWSSSALDWENAPANVDDAATVDSKHAIELGRFVVERGKQYGQVSIQGEKLVQFLNSDTNSLVTLIVVRATRELSAGGLVHGFANRSNSIAAPPALILTTSASSEAE